jgi:hypothetical protein
MMRIGDLGNGTDGGIIVGDNRALAYEYCQRGGPVDFQTLVGDDHYSAVDPFEAQAQAFMNDRYAGTAAMGNCGSFGAGNALTPLTYSATTTSVTATVTKPARKAKPVRLRLRGVAVEHRARGVVVALSTRGGSAGSVTVELTRNRRVVASVRISRLTAARRRAVLSVHRRMPGAGRYVIVDLLGHTRELRAGVTIRPARR